MHISTRYQVNLTSLNKIHPVADETVIGQKSTDRLTSIYPPLQKKKKKLGVAMGVTVNNVKTPTLLLCNQTFMSWKLPQLKF